jgi:Trk-type K+ transport system membrane component
MLEYSTGSFVTMAVLIFVGGITLLLLPPMIIRHIQFTKIRANITAIDSAVQKEFEQMDRSIVLTIWVIAGYILFWYIFGTLSLYGALFIHPVEPELKKRNVSRFANAAFLVLSHFNSCGLTVSSSSVVYLQNNPLAYIILALVNFAGNTMAPIFLRFVVVVLVRMRSHFGWHTESYQYILDHPRRITTHIFPHETTMFLVSVTLMLNGVQYIFCLAS